MALLRRARKDVSMAALVEAHRRHVEQEEDKEDEEADSSQFSESDTITVADSDDTATPDSQGFREYNESSNSATLHCTPPRPRKQDASNGLVPEPGKDHDARRCQRRPSAKVSAALRKPMQMMRAQRRARTIGDNDALWSSSGGGDVVPPGGSERETKAGVSPITVDAQGVVQVDAALIRYIDETLVKPNHHVFNTVTRFFLDPHLERIYQDYTAVSWFARARWHIALLMLVHLLVMLLFLVLPPSGFEKTDQFILSSTAVSTYLQWLYLLVAVPFACLPRSCNPFQKRWRIWACLIVVLFTSAFQLWLAHAGQLALEQFRTIVTDQLECSVANTLPVNVTKVMRVDESSSGSGSAAWVEVGTTNASSSSLPGADTFKVNVSRPLMPAELAKKTLEQRTYVLVATDLYANGLLQVLTGFTVLFIFILVISIRLEFVYVMAVGLSALASYTFAVLVFSIHLEWLTAFTHAFAVVLLFIQSRSADLTNRRSFLSSFVIEKENEALQSSLYKAEAALLNEPAGAKEIEVVEHVLEVPAMKALEAFRIPFADLKFFEAIGRGAMGDVIKAKYLGTVVVCKRLRRENITETALESFREEIALMACLRHPNIVQFIGASWDNYSNLCIVMEYLENGDMHTVLNSSIGKSFTWADPLLKMAIDIVQGMLYLHSQEPPIVHRDLKSVNVLCSKTYGCNVGDFGLSRRYKRDDVNPLKTIVGTPFWLAPELIRSDRYGPAADVYSFGIVLTELETRKMPYHELTVNEAPPPRLRHPRQHQQQPHQQERSANPRSGGIKVLMRIAYDGLRPTLPPSCLPLRRKLITDCLLEDADARPTFADILVRLQGVVQREVEDDAIGLGSTLLRPSSV